MARKRDSLADMLSCQVCLEEFEEEGNHTPKIFSCLHTVCESCIKKMIKENKLGCPECRTEHRAEKKEKSFPQNKYLLVQIRRRKEETNGNEKCKNHGKELNAFCTMCQQNICISCVRKDHEGHDWIEIEEREKEALVQQVTNIRKNLEAKSEMISKVTKDVAEKNGLMCEKIEEEEHVAKMIEEAERQGKETSKQTEKELSAVKENIECLRSIQNDIADDATDYNTIRQYRETVRETIDNNQANLTGRRCYQFPVLKLSQPNSKETLGKINREAISLMLPGCESLGTLTAQLPRRIARASELKCTGKNPF